MSLLGELLAGRTAKHSSVFDRYTEATRRAIYFARQESVHRGSSVIAVADLLAGLGEDESSRAERIGSLKSNAFYLRWLVGLPALPARAEDSLESKDESQIELDREAKRAFAFALMEADRDREYWIDSDHLLRGILRFPNRAHFAILKTEVNLHTARAASKADRALFRPYQTPGMKVVKYLVRQHLAQWAPPILGLACYLYILIQGISPTASPLAK